MYLSVFFHEPIKLQGEIDGLPLLDVLVGIPHIVPKQEIRDMECRGVHIFKTFSSLLQRNLHYLIVIYMGFSSHHNSVQTFKKRLSHTHDPPPLIPLIRVGHMGVPRFKA